MQLEVVGIPVDVGNRLSHLPIKLLPWLPPRQLAVLVIVLVAAAALADPGG